MWKYAQKRSPLSRIRTPTVGNPLYSMTALYVGGPRHWRIQSSRPPAALDPRIISAPVGDHQLSSATPPPASILRPSAASSQRLAECRQVVDAIVCQHPPNCWKTSVAQSSFY